MSKKEKKIPKKKAIEEESKEKTKKTKKTKKKTTKKTRAKKKTKELVITKGDFLMMEMTGRAVETGEVFDTTDEETAKNEGIYKEDKTYGSELVVVGEGWVLKGLDERLPGVKLDQKVEIEISPEEAFGERSPENVQTIPYRILRSKGVNPILGSQVQVDGRTAVVRSVGAGRVQLDYNHPLAGRKIIYEVNATKRFEEDEDKVKALIGRRFLGIELNKFKLKRLKKKIRIQIPDEIFFGENIQIAKRGVALDIQRFFPDIDIVEYVEVVQRAA